MWAFFCFFCWLRRARAIPLVVSQVRSSVFLSVLFYHSCAITTGRLQWPTVLTAPYRGHGLHSFVYFTTNGAPSVDYCSDGSYGALDCRGEAGVRHVIRGCLINSSNIFYVSVVWWCGFFVFFLRYLVYFYSFSLY